MSLVALFKSWIIDQACQAKANLSSVQRNTKTLKELSEKVQPILAKGGKETMLKQRSYVDSNTFKL